VRHGTASFEIEPPDEAEMTRRHEISTPGAFPFLVAEIAGTFVGYAYAGPYARGRPIGWTLEDSIYIAPNMQRVASVARCSNA